MSKIIGISSDVEGTALQSRPCEAKQTVASTSRVVIRDKSNGDTSTPQRETKQAFINKQSDIVHLVSHGKGKSHVVLEAIPKEDVSPYLAHVDWLGFTFCLPEGKSLDWFFKEIERITTNIRVVEVDENTGWNGYCHTASLGDYGFIAWGGKYQRGTIHVEINATGCARIKNWVEVVAFGNSINSKITRVDLAHDDFIGEICSIESVFEWYEIGGFVASGRPPKLKIIGDWTDLTDGRTLNIGTRGSKFLRVYEKGKQLKDPSSLWVRVELQLNNKNRIIPWETLLTPGHYLAGSYPCLSFLSNIQSKIKTCQRGAEISVAVMTENASRLSGKAINALMQLNGEDASLVVRKLRRYGMPKRLVPFASAFGEKDENT